MPFKQKTTEVLKRNAPQREDLIHLGQINEKYKKQRLRFLIWIGACLAILIVLVTYAAIRAGGLQNLIKGDSDIITNTVTNVGNTITNPTESPTPTPTIFTINITTTPTSQVSSDKEQNTLILTNFDSPYNIRVRKGSYILFVNNTNKLVGLQFSDGRRLRFEIGESQNVAFINPGTATFVDVIDSNLNQIKGSVVVE